MDLRGALGTPKREGSERVTILPQNLEAEEYVLGAMMISEKAVAVVSDILDASDFFRESHGKIYRAALALWLAGEAVDPITLTHELEQRGEIEEVGGRTRLHELSIIVPASANVGHYAEIVRDHSFDRGLIRAGGEIAQLGWEREGEPGDRLIAAEELIDTIRGRADGERDELMGLHAAAEHLDRKFRNPPDANEGIEGPWRFVARMKPGRMYVLGGYSADGKTAAACQFFIHALKAAVPSSFLTLEMSGDDLAERIASSMGIPARSVQTGRLTEADVPKMRSVLGEMVRLAEHGVIWDAPGADIATIRRHVKVRRPQFLIVDHLHQFHIRAEYDRQDLEAVVRGLWRIAREFNITILLLGQLSRSGDKRHPFPIPSMSSLKGSGAIEQLAWAVWFVYRQRDENHLATNDGLFIVAKDRSGPTQTKPLMFHPREVRYSEVLREG